MTEPQARPSSLDPRRAQNVGASEIASLFSALWLDGDAAPDDLGSYETRYALWMRKAGKIPPAEEKPILDGSDPMFWGSVLEKGIADGVRLKTGWTIEPGGFVLHPTVAGMSATTDFEITAGLDSPAVLEIKKVSPYRFRKWPERVEPGVLWRKRGEWVPAERQPPFAFKLQVQAQMACRGHALSVIAPLVDNDGLLYLIARHTGTIARIEAEVTEFWRSIAADEPPDPNYALDGETIAALYGLPNAGTFADLRGNEEALAAALRYSAAQAAEKTAEKEKKAAQAEIIDLIGKAERAHFGNGYNLWAGEVKAQAIAYDRKAYRGFLLTHSKKGF